MNIFERIQENNLHIKKRYEQLKMLDNCNFNLKQLYELKDIKMLFDDQNGEINDICSDNTIKYMFSDCQDIISKSYCLLLLGINKIYRIHETRTFTSIQDEGKDNKLTNNKVYKTKDVLLATQSRNQITFHFRQDNKCLALKVDSNVFTILIAIKVLMQTEKRMQFISMKLEDIDFEKSSSQIKSHSNLRNIIPISYSEDEMVSILLSMDLKDIINKSQILYKNLVDSMNSLLINKRKKQISDENDIWFESCVQLENDGWWTEGFLIIFNDILHFITHDSNFSQSLVWICDIEWLAELKIFETQKSLAIYLRQKFLDINQDNSKKARQVLLSKAPSQLANKINKVFADITKVNHQNPTNLVTFQPNMNINETASAGSALAYLYNTDQKQIRKQKIVRAFQSIRLLHKMDPHKFRLQFEINKKFVDESQNDLKDQIATPTNISVRVQGGSTNKSRDLFTKYDGESTMQYHPIFSNQIQHSKTNILKTDKNISHLNSNLFKKKRDQKYMDKNHHQYTIKCNEPNNQVVQDQFKEDNNQIISKDKTINGNRNNPDFKEIESLSNVKGYNTESQDNNNKDIRDIKTSHIIRISNNNTNIPPRTSLYPSQRNCSQNHDVQQMIFKGAFKDNICLLCSISSIHMQGCQQCNQNICQRCFISVTEYTRLSVNSNLVSKDRLVQNNKTQSNYDVSINNSSYKHKDRQQHQQKTNKNDFSLKSDKQTNNNQDEIPDNTFNSQLFSSINAQNNPKDENISQNELNDNYCKTKDNIHDLTGNVKTIDGNKDANTPKDENISQDELNDTDNFCITKDYLNNIHDLTGNVKTIDGNKDNYHIWDYSDIDTSPFYHDNINLFLNNVKRKQIDQNNDLSNNY